MEALGQLLLYLEQADYRFVTPTPATHARVLDRRRGDHAKCLADALGWSLPFRPGKLDATVERCLRAADMLDSVDGLHKSRVRVSSLHGRLYLHSAYPTDSADAVFFGPDSYRFANLIVDELAATQPARMLDIGTGAGVGGIVAADTCPDAGLVMTDVNPEALRLAAINAANAGVQAQLVKTGTLDRLDGQFDVIMANPPYIIDDSGRTYRDGGAMHGAELSLDMAKMALDKLSPHGRLILYTGSAIMTGEDRLRARLAELASDRDCRMRYRELDPDVFGEELENETYRDVDRIALVAATIVRF